MVSNVAASFLLCFELREHLEAGGEAFSAGTPEWPEYTCDVELWGTAAFCSLVRIGFAEAA